MADFTGKAVIITGASSGFGRVIALELGKAGADLWLVGRSAEELEATRKMVADAGGPEAHCVPMDLAERGPIGALVREVGVRHPHLFALISNAGVMHAEPIMQGTVARWEAMFDINVLAMLEGCRAAVEVMRGHRKPGHLINVSSMAARFEVPGVYGITKRAVDAIGDSLRQELENDDIRIATIVPGGFATQLGRGLLPEQLEGLMKGFEERGIAPDGPGAERLLGDPQHIANMVRYILSQPIELNIQEVVLRPPVSLKLD